MTSVARQRKKSPEEIQAHFKFVLSLGLLPSIFANLAFEERETESEKEALQDLLEIP